MKAGSLTSLLLTKIIQILALDVLKDPETYIDNTYSLMNRFLSLYSKDVFPYKEESEEDEQVSSLKKQYDAYIKALESGNIKPIDSSNTDGQ